MSTAAKSEAAQYPQNLGARSLLRQLRLQVVPKLAFDLLLYIFCTAVQPV